MCVCFSWKHSWAIFCLQRWQGYSLSQSYYALLSLHIVCPVDCSVKQHFNLSTLLLKRKTFSAVMCSRSVQKLIQDRDKKKPLSVFRHAFNLNLGMGKRMGSRGLWVTFRSDPTKVTGHQEVNLPLKMAYGHYCSVMYCCSQRSHRGHPGSIRCQFAKKKKKKRNMICASHQLVVIRTTVKSVV